MSSLRREDAHVTAVQIFKSHDDHHQYIQGQFLFQVTDYKIIDRKMTQDKRSMLAPVPFGTTPSKLSCQTGLLELVRISVSDSKAFSDLTSKILAEKITAKIMSRFRFTTTTSCSKIIIAVNVDMIDRSGDVPILDLDNANADAEDGNDDSEGTGDSEDDSESDDDEDSDDDEYYNRCSGFEEECISDIKGFSEVTGLESVKPDELNPMDRCSICLEEYGSDYCGVVKAETSVCCHVFHRDCIRPWLRRFSNQCPLCRSIFIAQI